MVTPVAVLRSGKEYNERHVRALARSIPGLVALSDIDIPGVVTVRLRYNFPGWWSKLELFSDAIPGDLLYFDLDTVVLGSIEPLLKVGKSTVLRDFYKPNLMGSGLMYIAESDKPRIWEAFIADPDKAIRTCVTRAKWGDQGFLQDFLGNAQKWQDILPGEIVSYKVDCRRRLPARARVICFHGKPRPWDLPLPWIPKL
jgi:hypothetical protein